VERVCDYVLVATPYGDELNRDFGDAIPEFNHVSVWMPEDFTSRGYSVVVEPVTLQVKTLRLYQWLIHLYARLKGKHTPYQKKIIAVRNSKNITVSRGLNFAGLRKDDLSK
jgi:hypothetical protein